MTDAARNKQTLQQAYKLWHDSRGGSVDHWLSICADDIAFGSLAEGRAAAPFTAALRGRATLGTYFAGLLGGWTMQHYTIEHLVAEGDRVVAIGSTAWQNKATGKLCSTRKVDTWRFNGGKAIEFYEYFDTAGMFEAARP